MSRHDYTKYSNEKTIEDVEVHAVDTVIEPVIYPVVTPMETTVNTVILPETVKGVVVNCAKLNVRVKPSVDADVVCTLDSKTEVDVDVARSTSDWLNICTAYGVKGFCMRKYINAEV